MYTAEGTLDVEQRIKELAAPYEKPGWVIPHSRERSEKVRSPEFWNTWLGT